MTAAAATVDVPARKAIKALAAKQAYAEKYSETWVSRWDAMIVRKKQIYGYRDVRMPIGLHALNRLIRAGLVEMKDFRADTDMRGYPDVRYRLTDAGRAYLKVNP